MWDYTEKVMDHFLHPRNVGELSDPDGVGEVGNITCGDALKVYLKLDENKERIVDVKFQTFGCASAIASASALTELVKGRTLDEAARITNQDIADYLGQLPEEKMHCSVMGMEALQAAIANLQGEGPATTTVGAEHGETYDPEGLDRTVCYCFSVTERKIRDVIKANNLDTVDQVTHYCKAGGGCGGCREDIQSILDDVKDEREAAVAHKTAAPSAPGKLTNLQKIAKIQEALDNDIRPGLQADGGDLDLVDIDGDRVIVRLTGSCAGCPGAQVTLKRWVQAKLQELVTPELTVEEVQQ
ncbi:MAG: Fe-S cluster assembly protein NifU [Candidatus Pacebacteria bacterium]|nr:Fe-S cluster assembly protein NifU [Candidatus Paceibacterota bacterium]